MCFSSRSLLSVVVALGLFQPDPVAAQSHCRGGCGPYVEPEPTFATSDHLISLGFTAAVGGLTAGIRQAVAGGDFWDAFAQGAGGGVVGYIGKSVSGQRFAGSGLVGRQVSAVGGSIVLNASEGRPPFERMILPVGWVRLEIDRSEGLRTGLKIDVASVAATGYLLSGGSRMDWRSTLASGAPVLTGTEHSAAGGRHVAGVIQLRPDYPDMMRAARSHEQVHVAQSDFASIIWSSPLEAAAMSRLGLPPEVPRRVHFGAHHLLRAAAIAIIPYRQDPWEWEAHLLSDTEFWDN